LLGMIFAFLALAIGGFFFLYAIRYYISILFVLAPWVGRGAKEMYPEGNNSKNNEDPNGFSHRFANNNFNHSPAANGGSPLNYGGDVAPFVSIHLPFYNERNVADRILAACASLDYPNYEVVVVDDSTDETIETLKRWADHPRVKVIHREERTGFKGGALNVALDNTNPDAKFVVIYDADFVPPPDILQRFLYYFNGNSGGQQDRVAAVQGYQWHILNNKENWLTRGIRAEYSGSYLVERAFQQYLGNMKMIAGSVYMIRADLLRAYRWSESLTEDWELTLRLYEDGYKVKYTPYVATPAECPSSLPRLIRQRMRWAEGHTFNVRRQFWRVMRSSALSLREKLEFLYYTPYYLQSVLLILGTAFWVAAELMNAHLPWWTATLGWALLLSNLFALPLMNLSGLFLEMRARRDLSGSLIMIPLTFIVAPFQAYACLKGLFERSEGGWQRTLKTGKITEPLLALKLRKRLERIFARTRLNKGSTVRKKPEPGEKARTGQGPKGSKLALLLTVALTATIIVVSVLGTTVAQVGQVGSIPLYLHEAQPPGPSVSPSGKLMSNDSSTTEEHFAVFDGSDPSTWLRYWYTEVYPTGQDPAFIAAGPYTFYMYLAPPVNASWYTFIRVEVGHCNADGSGYVKLLETPTLLIFHGASLPVVIELGSAPQLQFDASSPKRLRLLIEYLHCRPLNMSYNNIPYKPTRLVIPHLIVPENALILLFVAPVLPAAVHKLRSSRKRGNSRSHSNL